MEKDFFPLRAKTYLALRILVSLGVKLIENHCDADSIPSKIIMAREILRFEEKRPPLCHFASLSEKIN